MALIIERVDWWALQASLAAIRRRVFIEEQGVPEALEWDGEDPHAMHLLAVLDGMPVGTARILQDGHIGRMAVLPEYRGRGIGRALLTQSLEVARDLGVDKVFLDAQTHALGFYERLGFRAEGNEFMDAGIRHRRMRRHLL